ncbi:MAG: VPLPA-CTERM sorting domain-containing protein [Thermodesulfobacteriota bacterium]|nr:VPLPA-CTERM sorting domain-containing protein [Thermodesulfobacteriota bacterium]
MFLTRPSRGSCERSPGYSAIVIAILILFLSPTPGLPSQIHFDIDTPTTGSISWAGGEAPLVGSDIEVDQVMGLGTPNYPDVAYSVTDGELDFQTGKCLDVIDEGPFYRWTFAGGGWITLTGGVDFDGDGSNIPTGTLLMDGEFSFCEVTYMDFYGAEKKWSVTFASFTDDKAEGLTTHYGMPSGLYNGNFNISFEAEDDDPTDGFESSDVLSGDISNYAIIPAPAAAWLLGSGLIGLVVVRRRLDKGQ